MGFVVVAYLLQTLSGGWMFVLRQRARSRPDWLRPLHMISGGIMVGLVMLLLLIGIVGTLGHYGRLGHSWHLPAGLMVVNLVFLSAWSAAQISPERPWARPFHVSINAVLLVALVLVSLTGWQVIQKYLPS